MNANLLAKDQRNSTRPLSLAALALVACALGACAGAPGGGHQASSGMPGPGAVPAPAPVTTAALAPLPLYPPEPTAGAGYDRLQLASAAVSREELQEHRGGFITVDGLQVDFAFQQISMVNDLQQITSTITLNQMLAGQPGTVTVGDVVSSGSGTVTIAGLDGGITEITHNVLPTSINTVFANTSSGIDASNTVNLVIDIVGIDTVRTGHRVGLKPMNLEIRNALIHALGN